MPFDWLEYLKLARWLSQNAPIDVSQEAARRAAISRAYYAAFGYARKYAVDWLGFVPREAAEDHGRLAAHLKSRRRHATAESLARLRGWRNDCDYSSEFAEDLAAAVTSALKDADYVVASLPLPKQQ